MSKKKLRAVRTALEIDKEYTDTCAHLGDTRVKIKALENTEAVLLRKVEALMREKSAIQGEPS